MSKENLKVSVCVVTYNQEKFIRQCLQSVVEQETDFDFEVIVGDDCSTDGTREIIQEFAEKYPCMVKPVFQEKNIGPTPNYFSVHSLAKGEYIAHLDGDDYMLPSKLQVQKEVLDKNPDCAMCTHNMLFSEGSQEINERWYKIAEGKKDLNFFALNMPFFFHSSIMYVKDKAKLLKDIKEGMHIKEGMLVLDVELEAGLLRNGPDYHLARTLGVYRVCVGISTQNNFKDVSIKNNLMLLDSLKDILKIGVIEKARAKKLAEFSYQYLIEGELDKYRSNIRSSVASKVYGVQQILLYIFSSLPKIAYMLVQFRIGIKWLLNKARLLP